MTSPNYPSKQSCTFCFNIFPYRLASLADVKSYNIQFKYKYGVK